MVQHRSQGQGPRSVGIERSRPIGYRGRGGERDGPGWGEGRQIFSFVGAGRCVIRLALTRGAGAHSWIALMTTNSEVCTVRTYIHTNNFADDTFILSTCFLRQAKRSP